MRRRRLLWLAFAGLASSSFSMPGMGQRRLWRIGYHSGGSADSNAGWLDSFRKGMAELGWSEARDYVIDARYADGNQAANKRLAAELVATQPDVILTTAEGSIFVLAGFTKTIPIVFALGADPVGNRYVASLQRPGGNLTGLTALTADLAAKRLELLKEAFPKTTHVLVLFEPTDPAAVSQVRGLEAAAPRLNVRLTFLEVRQPADIDAAFQRSAKPAADACMVVSGPLMNIQRKSIAARAIQLKMPSIASNAIYADAGVLIAYAASAPANFHRAAAYVDKILKGAKPGDLAIEQPTKFTLTINAGTAKALGATIPQSVMLRADRVIE
ncbi:MAG TPA: ABC transporter substrate-binding protein [Burkholderiales bacterium]|nr:ABC transporter substrate-binding protein [Burkholderiales bacterium]